MSSKLSKVERVSLLPRGGSEEHPSSKQAAMKSIARTILTGIKRCLMCE